MSEELKPLLGKNFDMGVNEDGNTLRVILTRKKP
jgi:hypothetical protein